MQTRLKKRFYQVTYVAPDHDYGYQFEGSHHKQVGEAEDCNHLKIISLWDHQS